MMRLQMDDNGLKGLVEAFYARVRVDKALGPIFNDAISDWPEHLEKLAGFWSSVMLTSGRYKGQPVPAHMKHRHRITPALFERWLALWTETTDELMEADVAAELQAKARRIAESLQLTIFFRVDCRPVTVTANGGAFGGGFHVTAKGRDNSPGAEGHAPLNAPTPYRSTPVFDQETLPSALQGRHATKMGVWGLIRVIEGKVRLTYLAPPSEILLGAKQAVIVLPEQPHFVTPLGPMKMQVDFYDQPPG